MPSALADLTWTDVRELARGGALLAVPVGSTEQHGPHLPLSTDTDIALALCAALAERRADVLVAPPLAYGSSGEHAGFAGTISIGQEATELVLLELGRSAAETFDHLLFVSAHGGNAEPVTRAVRRLHAESRDVSLWQPAWDGDPHAGHTETSLQLLLHPELVHPDRAEVGETRPVRELIGALRSGGVRAVSGNGVLGDPTNASVRSGETTFAQLLEALVRHVEEWRV